MNGFNTPRLVMDKKIPSINITIPTQTPGVTITITSNDSKNKKESTTESTKKKVQING